MARSEYSEKLNESLSNRKIEVTGEGLLNSVIGGKNAYDYHSAFEYLWNLSDELGLDDSDWTILKDFDKEYLVDLFSNIFQMDTSYLLLFQLINSMHNGEEGDMEDIITSCSTNRKMVNRNNDGLIRELSNDFLSEIKKEIINDFLETGFSNIIS